MHGRFAHVTGLRMYVRWEWLPCAANEVVSRSIPYTMCSVCEGLRLRWFVPNGTNAGRRGLFYTLPPHAADICRMPKKERGKNNEYAGHRIDRSRVSVWRLYALRPLAGKQVGIDPSAKTPAVVHEDGRDYVPTDGWTVFAHQFSSIAGAGPVTGAIQAAAFGWLPVLLWVLLGGIFFGAVTDFGALYASVKNDGKSMGMLIEKYIGKTGRKLFLLFCWLFCGIVIAAFADMVAGTFNAYGADGALVEAAQTNGAAGMVSIMFMVFAVIFGLLQKNLHFTGWKENVISIVFIVLSFVVGANFPIILGKAAWSYITFVYIFFAAVLPMWLLKQPRDHMTTFMFVAMIVGAVLGLIVNHPVMNLPVFTGFTNAKLGTMFPILFVTVACGAVSGFHSLVSSGTSSKTVTNEKDMLKVGYGAWCWKACWLSSPCAWPVLLLLQTAPPQTALRSRSSAAALPASSWASAWTSTLPLCL